MSSASVCAFPRRGYRANSCSLDTSIGSNKVLVHKSEDTFNRGALHVSKMCSCGKGPHQTQRVIPETGQLKKQPASLPLIGNLVTAKAKMKDSFPFAPILISHRI